MTWPFIDWPDAAWPEEPRQGNSAGFLLTDQPGALLMAIGVDVLHLRTTYWIGHLVARKTNTYGPVRDRAGRLAVGLLPGWVMVASAGLNAALVHRSRSR